MDLCVLKFKIIKALTGNTLMNISMFYMCVYVYVCLFVCVYMCIHARVNVYGCILCALVSACTCDTI